MGSVTHILMNCYDNNVANTKVLFSTHIASYILEQLSVVSTAANESILASLTKQTESSPSSQCDGMPNNFPVVAWLGYF